MNDHWSATELASRDYALPGRAAPGFSCPRCGYARLWDLGFLHRPSAPALSFRPTPPALVRRGRTHHVAAVLRRWLLRSARKDAAARKLLKGYAELAFRPGRPLTGHRW